MQSFIPLPGIRSSEDQRAQCWRDVEAETGFASYKSFLEALGPDFEGILWSLKDFFTTARFDADFGEVFVLDILKDGSTSISLKIPSDDCSATSLPERLRLEMSTRLLQNLRSPPDNVPARVVLWSIPWKYDLCTEIVDALGLGLKIQPSFFDTLISITTPYFNSLRPNGSDSVKIGNSVATVARDYQLGGDAPPVLLVAGNYDLMSKLNRYSRSEQPYHKLVEEVLERGINGRMLPYRSATDKCSPNSLAPILSNQYLRLLSEHFRKDHSSGAEGGALLLTAVLPLLHLEILRIRVQCRILESTFLEVQYGVEMRNPYSDEEKEMIFSGLDKERFWLRRRLEGLEEGRNGFVKYVRSQDAAKWLTGKTWLSQDEEIRDAITEARAKEAEARDYIQLQIGSLSILESRKSIQLSNQQMDEAKRVKIFTILAFVYVPINLATSIFGMNLQQLNQSGQTVGSFLVTASVSLLVTGFMWFCLEDYNSIMDWNRKTDEEKRSDPNSGPDHSVTLRVFCFLSEVNPRTKQGLLPSMQRRVSHISKQNHARHLVPPILPVISMPPAQFVILLFSTLYLPNHLRSNNNSSSLITPPLPTLTKSPPPTMSIRVLDHNGTTHQLSTRMIADFQSELRRIREVPSAPTVNIWVSNQTPEELLEILKRIPDRPAGDGNGRDGVQALLHAENPVATAANQAGDPKSDVQAAKTPHRPEKPAPNGNPRLQRRVYEGVYQCDTGRINADSGGEGKWVIRDAKYVKLSKEEERELERRDSKDGYKDGEPKKRL